MLGPYPSHTAQLYQPVLTPLIRWTTSHPRRMR